MVCLLRWRQFVELIGLHPQKVLSMLSYDINAGASREICEGDAKGVGADGINDLLAVHALIKSHFLLVSRSLAVSAGLIRFLSGNIEGP